MKCHIMEIRKEKSVTQKDLADKIGVKRQFISNIEREKIMPSLRLAYKIAKELNVCICDLFEEE